MFSMEKIVNLTYIKEYINYMYVFAKDTSRKNKLLKVVYLNNGMEDWGVSFITFTSYINI